MARNELMESCPLCGAPLRRSPHLEEAFKGDAYGLWLARTVTHYRHDHLTSYNRAYLSSAYARKIPGYSAMGHEAYRALVNERAKRQIIRGVLKSSLPREVKALLIGAVPRLEHQDPKTIALVEEARRKIWHAQGRAALKMRDDRQSRLDSIIEAPK